MKKEYAEQAAQQYAEGPECTWVGTTALEYAFIAGAKWQEEHAPLPEDTVIWNDGFKTGREIGARDMKEQMLKEAVEGEVENATLGIVYLRKNLVNEGYSTGDKVRVIIIKE